MWLSTWHTFCPKHSLFCSLLKSSTKTGSHTASAAQPGSSSAWVKADKKQTDSVLDKLKTLYVTFWDDILWISKWKKKQQLCVCLPLAVHLQSRTTALTLACGRDVQWVIFPPVTIAICDLKKTTNKQTNKKTLSRCFHQSAEQMSTASPSLLLQRSNSRTGKTHTLKIQNTPSL